MNKLLSICIPTYNRSKKLKENIEHILSYMDKYNIDVYVSDNASEDNTSDMIASVVKENENIHYYLHETNMGFAHNCAYVLDMAKGKYRWLLGDDDIIEEHVIKSILDIIEQDEYDLVVINGGNPLRIPDYSEKVINDKNEVMKNIGGHITWMSCLIFNSENNNFLDLYKYKDNAFPHVIFLFKMLGEKCKVSWNKDLSISSISDGCGFMDKYFQIFIYDWYHAVYDYDEYDKKSKDACFQQGIEYAFGFVHLFLLRAKGQYSQEIYSKHKKELSVLPFFMRLQFILPLVFIEPLRKIAYKIYKITKQIIISIRRSLS